MKDNRCPCCNHSWYGQTPNMPKVCPKCKSPYWNKERVRKVKKELEK